MTTLSLRSVRARSKCRVWGNTLSICGAPEEATALYGKLDKLIAQGKGKIAMGFGGNPKDSSAVRGGPAFEVLFNVDTYLKRKGIRDQFELTFLRRWISLDKRWEQKH